MHKDLTSYLHSEKCNELIEILQVCRKEHPFLKFLGKCDPEFHIMERCLKEERLERRKINLEKSLESKERRRKMLKEEHEHKNKESL